MPGWVQCETCILFCEGWTYHFRSVKTGVKNIAPSPPPFLLINALFFFYKPLPGQNDCKYPTVLIPQAYASPSPTECLKLLGSKMWHHDKFREKEGSLLRNALSFHFTSRDYT